MTSRKDQLTIILKKGNQRLIAKTPLPGVDRIVVVVNRQFTNAPNTTQIASGAGHSSAGGSNAAIDSPYVRQQQSVGAGGKAINRDGKSGPVGAWRLRGSQPTVRGKARRGKEVVIVVNDQVAKLPRGRQDAAAIAPAAPTPPSAAPGRGSSTPSAAAAAVWPPTSTATARKPAASAGGERGIGGVMAIGGGADPRSGGPCAVAPSGCVRSLHGLRGCCAGRIHLEFALDSCALRMPGMHP